MGGSGLLLAGRFEEVGWGDVIVEVDEGDQVVGAMRWSVNVLAPCEPAVVARLRFSDRRQEP